MFSKLTIGQKLVPGSLSVTALVLLLGVVSIVFINSIGNMQDRMAAVDVKWIQAAGTIDANINKMETAMHGAVLGGLVGDRSHTDASRREFADAKAVCSKALGELRELSARAGNAALVRELEDKLALSASMFDDIARLAANNQGDQALKILQEKADALVQESDALSERAVAAGTDSAANLARETDSVIYRSKWMAVVCSLLALLGGAGLALVVRQICVELRSIAGDLSQGASQVAGAAGQVASASQSLARTSTEQAASVEETSASREEINSMARKNSENSRSAAGLVGRSHQTFQQSSRALDQMVAAMGDIKGSSDRISKIIKVIEEIAFQTNILALNAAVEAARAGEAGMGFAVVADEVRNLAQRCAQAARDTTVLIEESIATSSSGKTKVDEVAAAIRAAVENGQSIATLVNEMEQGSRDQERGIDEIGKALTQIEQATQGAAANAEETAAAAEELSAQSEHLHEVVARLNAMTVGGDGVRRFSGASAGLS